MYIEKLQKQRFELKYVIDEPTAQRMRHYVQNYLTIDEYGATQPDLSYPVHSLYLDSPAYKTYFDTLNGNRNRFKLRIRYYEKANDETAFLEIKQRYDRVIAKKRAKVPVKALDELIYGPLPSFDQFPGMPDNKFKDLFHICRIIHELNAQPKAHVSYKREAYELEGSNAVRITFDRNVTTEEERELLLVQEQQNPVRVFDPNCVILELKFTNRYPYWMNDLIQHFQLRRESAAKYVDGIKRLKRKRIA